MVTVKIKQTCINNAYVDWSPVETARHCVWCWMLRTLDSKGCHFQNVTRWLRPVSRTFSQHLGHAVPSSVVCSTVHDSLDLSVNYTSTASHACLTNSATHSTHQYHGVRHILSSVIPNSFLASRTLFVIQKNYSQFI